MTLAEASAGTGNMSETAINSILQPSLPTSTGAAVVSQLQPTAMQQPTGFDSGIASYVCDQVAAVSAVSPSNVVEPSLQPTIPDPSTFLSPAPLPSSLFLTTAEAETQVQVAVSLDLGGVEGDSIPIGGGIMEGGIGGGEVVDGVIAEGEIGEVITTAGVPMGNLPTRSVIQPSSAAQSSVGDVWNIAPNVAAPVSGSEVCEHSILR